MEFLLPGRTPLHGNRGPTRPDRLTARPDGARQEKIVELCHEYLMREPAAGLSPSSGLKNETIKAFNIGYNDVSACYGLKVATGYDPARGPQTARSTASWFDGTRPKGNATRRYPAAILMGRLTGKSFLLITEGAFDMMLAWQGAGPRRGDVGLLRRG